MDTWTQVHMHTYMMHNPVGAPPANARSRGTHKKTATINTEPVLYNAYTSFSETLRIVWTGVLVYR